MTEDAKPIEVWRAFLETWKLWKRGVDRNLEKLGLSSTEYSILRHLIEDGKMPMVQMANLIKVTQGWITGLIDSMETNGLVKRGRIPADRRVIELTITEKGVELFEKAKKVHLSYIDRTMENMDREMLASTLSVIKDLKDRILDYDEQDSQ